MFQKIPPKFHDKAVQSNILWLDFFLKIGDRSILQSAHKQGNPSFYFHAPGSKRRSHALKQHRLSQSISPVCSSFVLVIASDMHLGSESENERKTLIYTQLNVSSNNQHFFAIFRRILISWPPTYLL